MTIAKYANLALSFLLELCMLAAFGYWGLKTGSDGLTQVVLGIGTPLLVAVIWGIFLAPASSRRLRNPLRLVLEATIFGVAILALHAAGQSSLASLLGIVYVINKALQFVWRQ